MNIRSVWNKAALRKRLLCLFLCVMTGVLGGCAGRGEKLILDLPQAEDPVRTAQESSETTDAELPESGADVKLPESAADAERSESGADAERSEGGADADSGELPLYVHVCGAVKQPGVYRAAQGTRIFEVIELAGGFEAEADPDALNLAQTVQDGMQVCVPEKGETGFVSYGEKMPAGDGASGTEPVNLNTATAEILTTLPGIGEVKAEHILTYREEHGGFRSVEELLEVTGIGNALYEQVRSMVTI